MKPTEWNGETPWAVDEPNADQRAAGWEACLIALESAGLDLVQAEETAPPCPGTVNGTHNWVRSQSQPLMAGMSAEECTYCTLSRRVHPRTPFYSYRGTDRIEARP